jgi:selenocysteine-specific elongation factor
VQLHILAEAAQGIKHRQFVRLHIGSNQATAQVLMGQREVTPGQTAFAVLRCGAPIVAEYNQPIVLRKPSPARTIGGGRIIAPALGSAERLRQCLDAAPGLADADSNVRLAAAIDLHGETRLDASVASSIGLGPSECEQIVANLVEQKKIVRCSGAPPVLVGAGRFDQLKRRMIRRIQSELERRRPAPQVPLSGVLSVMSRQASEPVLETLLQSMAEQQEILISGDRVGLPTGPKLSNRERSLLKAVLDQIAAAAATPPTLKELAEQHGCLLKDLELLLQTALDEGELVRISPQLVLERRALEALRKQLADYFQKRSTGTVSEIREHWQMTRKHAVPILEYFDEQRMTLRSSDSRSAGPRLTQTIDEVRP